PVPPGNSAEFRLKFARVTGEGFTAIAYGDDRTDAVLLSVTASNADPAVPASDGFLRDTQYVRFDRFESEESFWFPDLIITNVSWTPESPTVGDSTTVSFEVKNQGPRTSDAASIQFEVDTKQLSAANVPTIAPGATTVVDFTWTATLARSVLGGTVDVADAVSESNESNNQRSAIFSGGLLPDLVVKSVSYSPESPSAGDDVTVTVELANVGAGNAAASRVAAHLDEATSMNFFIQYPSLEAGDSATLSFTWSAKKGPFSMRFVADHLEAIQETSDANNTTEVFHTATVLSELAYRLGFKVTNPSGSTYTLQLNLVNHGPGYAPASQIWVFHNGASTVKHKVDIPRMAPGEEGTVSFTGSATNGRVLIRAMLDGGEVAPETNETNNDFVVAIAN
ncbi:MAG: CARDB domain-containing protein, partial [Dehalococcoidia bacterium]